MAQKVRIQSNTTTLAAEYARRGQDWETQVRQRAKEHALMVQLGVPISVQPGSIISPADQAMVNVLIDDDESDENPQEAD